MMTRTDILARLTDRLTLALTMWAEAGGDSRQGNSSVEERIAVGCVIRNRLLRWQSFRATSPTYKAVCLAPWQFSCWNDAKDQNHLRLMAMADRLVQPALPVQAHDPLVDECLFLADGIMASTVLDRTRGATMYYAPKSMIPAGKVPTAAKAFVAKGGEFLPIGDQLFYV